MGPEEKRFSEVPGLIVVRHVSMSAARCHTYEPSIAVMAQGRKVVQLGGTEYVYGGGQYLLTSVELPIMSRIVEASEKAPFLALALRLEMPVVRELLSRDEITVPDGRPDRPAMVVGDAGEELLDACCRLVGLLRAPSDIPFLAGLIQREIIYRVLRGPEGARLREIATLGDQSHRTAKAIAWIRTNFAKPLRVEVLAEVAGMGVSTLHHHFRALTSMSPLQYQKQVRLHAARERMLDGMDAASAAFEVGYESASQFSREYSRFFGQPPMRDVRALRTPNGLPQEVAS